MFCKKVLFSLLLVPLVLSLPDDFVRGLTSAVQEGVKAWAKIQGVGETEKPKTPLPSLVFDIVEPPIGRKIKPEGEDPVHYLKQLPELFDFALADAKMSYKYEGRDNYITTEGDWLSFFHFLGRNYVTNELTVRFTTRVESSQMSIWERTQAAVAAASEKLRTFGKSLISKEEVQQTDLDKEVDFLKEKGFSDFQGHGVVFEELGYLPEDWPAVVDQLVEGGLPEVWGKGIKLAAKARTGSNKNMITTSIITEREK